MIVHRVPATPGRLPEKSRSAAGLAGDRVYFAAAGRAGAGRAPPGEQIFASHILFRDWKGRIDEAERVEQLVHALGHWLGAVDSPDPTSVMRPPSGDFRARREVSAAVRRAQYAAVECRRRSDSRGGAGRLAGLAEPLAAAGCRGLDADRRPGTESRASPAAGGGQNPASTAGALLGDFGRRHEGLGRDYPRLGPQGGQPAAGRAVAL